MWKDAGIGGFSVPGVICRPRYDTASRALEASPSSTSVDAASSPMTSRHNDFVLEEEAIGLLAKEKGLRLVDQTPGSGTRSYFIYHSQAYKDIRYNQWCIGP